MDNQAKAIYALYAISVAVGVTAIVGVVLAYMAREDAPNWLASHYRFQIRTFWLLLLFSLIAAVLTVVLIGYLVLLATAVWLLVRCVKGWRHLDRREPVENVETWLF
ncbi:MAG: hypothetical protein OXI90_09065 [Gammaproteobacteria bacterium]|nr:hypothetical protein [Gammaproteobacteria bacterium]